MKTSDGPHNVAFADGIDDNFNYLDEDKGIQLHTDSDAGVVGEKIESNENVRPTTAQPPAPKPKAAKGKLKAAKKAMTSYLPTTVTVGGAKRGRNPMNARHDAAERLRYPDLTEASNRLGGRPWSPTRQHVYAVKVCV